jgi:hypothetical protein
VAHTNGPKTPVPLAAQNALFCIHAATNIEELQSVQIGGEERSAQLADRLQNVRPVPGSP